MRERRGDEESIWTFFLGSDFLKGRRNMLDIFFGQIRGERERRDEESIWTSFWFGLF